MAKFCTCGSLVISESCTNRKCLNHIHGTESASYDQIEKIRELCENLVEDEPENIRTMTMKEASGKIDELLDRLEDGEDG